MHTQCPACRSVNARRAFDALNHREGNGARGTYLRCDGCGTLRLSNAPAESALSVAYASGEIDPVASSPVTAVDRRAEPLSLGRRLTRAARRALFGRPHSWPEGPADDKRLLDFGCLDGGKLIEFYQRGWDVAGVDLNREGIARAQAQMPEGFFHAGPIQELAETETFDVIRTDNVLEHLTDPLRILQHLRGRLRTGGELLAYVPNGDSLSVRLFGQRSATVWVPYHLTLFSRRGLEALFTEAGFSSLEITPFSPPDWWSLTARQLVAKPGFLARPPSRIERVAMTVRALILPALLMFSRTPLAEEWVVRATSSQREEPR